MTLKPSAEPEVSVVREQHAAHYHPSNPKRGHDLEWFIFIAPKNVRPSSIPSDAEFHSGTLDGGVQFWRYCRTLPLSPGRCGRCP